MTIENMRKDDFYVPVLEALVELGGSGQIEEIQSLVVERAGLTPADLEAAYTKSGALMAPDKISWARSYLKEANLITNPSRGVWVITAEGRTALGEGFDGISGRIAVAMQAYNKAYAQRLQEKKAQQQDQGLLGGNSGQIEGEGPDDWTDTLLTTLKGMDPYAFERLSQRLLRSCGFTQVEVTGKSGDGGIDGKGVVRVNLVSFQILFQCKRWQGSVSASIVRDFRGAMQGRADKGLIITTGTFTPDARKEATRDGAPAIDLVDGQALCELLKEQRLGVAVEQIERVTVDPPFFAQI